MKVLKKLYRALRTQGAKAAAVSAAELGMIFALVVELFGFMRDFHGRFQRCCQKANERIDQLMTAIGLNGGSFNFNGESDSSMNTDQGMISLNGFGGIMIKKAGTKFVDMGVTTPMSMTLAPGVSITYAAGAGGLDASLGTGDFKFSTGNVSWTGASTKNVSIVSTGAGSSITITAGAASTWSTSSGALTITSAAAATWGTAAGALSLNGFAGINLQLNAATLIDIGVTSASAVTLAAGISLSAAAGTSGISMGLGTGATTLPTGNLGWTGASTKTVSIVSTGAGSSITITAGAASTWSTSSGALTLTSAAAATWSTAAGALAMSGFAGINLQVNGTTVADIGATSATALTLAAAKSLVFAAGTGGLDASLATGALKLGAASATLGFFGAAAVSKQNTTGTVQQTSAGAGTAIKTDSTTTGGVGATAYTVADLVLAMKNYGLLAS